MRTVFWDYDRDVMKMIDQRLLPFELVVPEYSTYPVSYTHLTLPTSDLV